MSLETIEQEIRSNLMRFAGLGYKVKFVFDDGPPLVLDGTVTPPRLIAGKPLTGNQGVDAREAPVGQRSPSTSHTSTEPVNP